MNPFGRQLVERLERGPWIVEIEVIKVPGGHAPKTLTRALVRFDPRRPFTIRVFRSSLLARLQCRLGLASAIPLEDIALEEAVIVLADDATLARRLVGAPRLRSLLLEPGAVLTASTKPGWLMRATGAVEKSVSTATHGRVKDRAELDRMATLVETAACGLASLGAIAPPAI